MSIKGIVEQEQPREKALLYGIETLTNQELLAILIRCGSKKANAVDLANKILVQIGGLENLMQVTLSDLTSIDGIKEAKALGILASVELNKRIRHCESRPTVQILSSLDAYLYMRCKLEFEKQEKVMVLYLNSKHQVVKEKMMFKGTINMSVISSREIYKEALLCDSVAIMVFHNHPSGSCEPSLDDIETTKKLKTAGICFDIVLLDHIIIGKNQYYSMADQKII